MGLLDVFKPKWQHSDLATRKQAVLALSPSDLDALLDIAKSDSDAEIRKIAVGKISSANVLTSLLQNENDASVQNAIKDSLRGQWLKTAKNHAGALTAEIRQILSDLQSKDIEELLKNAKSADVRLECVEKCSKQGLLAQVANADAQENVALAALAKIQRENLLEEIANESQHNSVRKKAREILAGIQNGKIDQVKEQRDSLLQKQKALLSHATRLLENKNPLSIDAEMQRLSAESASLGAQAATLGLTEKQEELNAAFEKHAKNIEAEKARIADEQEKQRAAEEAAKQEQAAKIAEQRTAAAQAEVASQENEPSSEASDSEGQAKASTSLEEKLSEEEYSAKVSLLQKIIDKVNSLDENGDFNEISQSIRQAFYDWREIVGEKKTQFKNIYKDFRSATNRFQNLQEWASWHAEQIRENLIKEMEDLANSPVVLENRAKAFALLEQWKTAGYMPAAKIQEFWPRFKNGLDKVMESLSPLLKEQEQSQEDNFKAKEQICAEIEEIAVAEGDWTEQLKKVQELQNKWKNVGFVPKDKNHALWERYQNAVGAFFKKQENYRKQKSEIINERIAIREKLCEEAEALSSSTDWINTPKQFTHLRAEWKTAGSIPTEQYEALLARFKAANDAFFEKRNAHFESSKSKREELCKKIEELNFEPTNEESVSVWKKIEEEWKALEGSGFAKELEAKFYAVSDRIWETLSKINPEIAKELDKNWEIKHGLNEKLKAILEQGNFKYKTLQNVRALQQEWQKTGRCGMAEAEISEKFNELVKNFFDEYNDQKEIRTNLDKVNAQKKEDLCAEAEALLEKAKSRTLNRAETVSEANALRASWRESGSVSNHLAKVLWERFNNACNAACHAFDDSVPVEAEAQ